MRFYALTDGDAADEINNALEWCVANGETLFMDPGTYVCTTQIIVPSGAKWIMDPQTILVKDFAGSVGDRDTNALIRNENCPTKAQLIVNPGPWTPSTTDDDIYIEGGRIRHNEATDIGGGVYLMGVTNTVLRNITVEHSRQDWAFGIGGDDIVLDRLRVEENDLVYEDGIHILYGNRIQIVEPYVNSGDDAIAFGTNYNLPIDDVTVIGGRVFANKGHALRFVQNREGSTSAFPPPTEKLTNIKVVGLTGKAGQLRNGVIETTVDVIADTAQAGTSTTMTLSADASDVDDFYVGGRLTITGGTGTNGQYREIIDYNGTTKVATVSSAWSVSPSSNTTYTISGVLVDGVDLADINIEQGDIGSHDGVNPTGVRFQYCRNIRLRSVSIRNPIRDGFYFNAISGELVLTDLKQTPTQADSFSYYGMQILNCDNVSMFGGSFERGTKTHAINVSNSKVTATNVYALVAGTGNAAFRVTNTTGETTRLILNGGRFVQASGASSCRVVRCDGTGCSYYLRNCDVTDISANSFNGSTPAESNVSGLVPNSRN